MLKVAHSKHVPPTKILQIISNNKTTVAFTHDNSNIVPINHEKHAYTVIIQYYGYFEKKTETDIFFNINYFFIVY